MNAITLAFICLYALPAPQASATELETIRANYTIAVEDKKTCEAMIDKLENNASQPIHRAYLGGFQTIWATHVFNPITKLSTFNKGKKNIDQAVAADSANVEIRFIRFSVQKNCPSFLGYNDHLEKDKAYIIANKHTISSALLRKIIADTI